VAKASNTARAVARGRQRNETAWATRVDASGRGPLSCRSVQGKDFMLGVAEVLAVDHQLARALHARQHRGDTRVHVEQPCHALALAVRAAELHKGTTGVAHVQGAFSLADLELWLFIEPIS